MNIIERKKCEIYHNEDLEELYCFKNFPTFMGCTQEDISNDLLFDMEWNISKSSGLIQLKKLLPLNILYPESHGAGCVGELWNQHHSSFAKFIRNYHPKNIIEIGGAHGILSKKYQDFEDIEWTIVEPNPMPIKGVNAKFIKSFFDDKFEFFGTYDCVVHSHVFEHIYEPNLFMNHLAKFIEEGKYLIFSIPHMQIMLERKYTNCINFEHTIFLTEPYIDYLLSNSGFRIDKKEYFMEDHSIFYACIKDCTIKPKELNHNLYKENKKLYLDYVAYHEKLVADLNEKLENSEKNIYLFGAHVFAQYLLAFGLNSNKIIYLLDNDPNKQDKRLYGTSLQVKSPKILKDIKEPVIILKAGVYNNEIKKDILENINPNTRFLE